MPNYFLLMFVCYLFSIEGLSMEISSLDLAADKENSPDSVLDSDGLDLSVERALEKYALENSPILLEVRKYLSQYGRKIKNSRQTSAFKRQYGSFKQFRLKHAFNFGSDPDMRKLTQFAIANARHSNQLKIVGINRFLIDNKPEASEFIRLLFAGALITKLYTTVSNDGELISELSAPDEEIPWVNDIVLLPRHCDNRNYDPDLLGYLEQTKYLLDENEHVRLAFAKTLKFIEQIKIGLYASQLFFKNATDIESSSEFEQWIACEFGTLNSLHEKISSLRPSLLEAFMLYESMQYYKILQSIYEGAQLTAVGSRRELSLEFLKQLRFGSSQLVKISRELGQMFVDGLNFIETESTASSSFIDNVVVPKPKGANNSNRARYAPKGGQRKSSSKTSSMSAGQIYKQRREARSGASKKASSDQAAREFCDTGPHVKSSSPSVEHTDGDTMVMNIKTSSPIARASDNRNNRRSEENKSARKSPSHPKKSEEEKERQKKERAKIIGADFRQQQKTKHVGPVSHVNNVQERELIILRKNGAKRIIDQLSPGNQRHFSELFSYDGSVKWGNQVPKTLMKAVREGLAIEVGDTLAEEFYDRFIKHIHKIHGKKGQVRLPEDYVVKLRAHFIIIGLMPENYREKLTSIQDVVAFAKYCNRLAEREFHQGS